MKKFYCRTFQAIMRVGTAFLPWRKPQMIVGENTAEELVNILKKKDISAVMIVTDAGIVKLGLHLPIFDSLKKANILCAVYDKTIPNPTIDNIEEGLTLYRENKCQAIIAIGGGSPMDCAKGIGARVVNPRKSISKMRGLLKVGKKLPPLFAVPTTAGTGSETTLAAVITDSKTHEKYAINDPHLIPHFALLDPYYTKSLPAGLTASTGMDALTHAVEAYIGQSNTKETRRSAEQAVKLIFENLEEVVKNGSNLVARENMQKASFLAGVAFTRAYVGNVHSIAHTLGGQYGVPHGLANAIILPKVLRYYGKTIYKPINMLCEKTGLFLEFLTPQDRTAAFISWIENLNKKFGIPETVNSLKNEDIEVLARRADKESNPLYPVPMIFELNDFINIYKQLLTK